jgi:hypothetical protein
MRTVLAVPTATMVLVALAPMLGPLALAPTASAEPSGNCPPACNRIPDTAWIAPSSIPLHSRYEWPDLAGLSVTARSPRFRFEELCASPPVGGDPRSFAVAARAAVTNAAGQWQMQAQVLHFSGETWWGGQLVRDTFAAAVAALRACQQTNAAASPSLTVADPDRVAAAVSGPVILHEYLLADPASSTITELSLWSDSPPQTPWPAVADPTVLDALAAPLCTAYISSCP